MMRTTPEDKVNIEHSLPVLVVKYGGNAMRNPRLQEEVLREITALHGTRFRVILVHGGGPFIAQTLDTAGVASEFIQGQRKTTAQAMPWVEMALKGRVNGKLVNLCQSMGVNAVGLSGKDGRIAVARKLWLQGENAPIDLGQVGEITTVDPTLLATLLDGGYFPVLCCVAIGEDGMDYNINADVFAAGIAGALKAEALVLLTDIDGLRQDINDPQSLIPEITSDDVSQLIEKEIVVGGMIPKLQACKSALQHGVGACYIVNGTKPERIARVMTGDSPGTKMIQTYVTTQ